MMLIRLDAKRYACFALTMLVATLIALGHAQPANSALYDNYLIGNGNSDAFTPQANGYFNEVARISAAAAAGATQVQIADRRNTGYAANSTGTGHRPTADITNLGSGRLAMIIQTQGLNASLAPSGGQAPINLEPTNIARFELVRISGAISGGTVNLATPLKYSYAATGAQIVSVPEFTSVTLADNRVMTAQPWNGVSGGVLAFLASGTVQMGAGSQFSVVGVGFRGGDRNGQGPPPTNCSALDGPNGGNKGEGVVAGFFGGTNRMRGNRANAAGGGDCENGGGGGGGNGGLGGRGGDAWTPDFPEWPVGGMGGQRLSYDPINRAMLGGGGGGGDQNNNQGGNGGAGGGIIFIRANALSGSGTLNANGAAGGQSGNVSAGDGAGGGGGAGVIHARFVGAANCAAATAVGGAGGTERSTGNNHGPGGAGGGGYALVQSAGGTCNTDVRAGVRGATLNGSTRGAGPVTQTEPSSVGTVQRPAGGMAAPSAAVSVPAAAQTVAITSTFSGTGTPGAAIDVYISGAGCNQGGVAERCGSTLVDGSGNWFYTTPALSGGSHQMYVVPHRLEIAGAQTAARSFTVDATPPAAPVITSPSGAMITNNPTPTISGTAEPNSTVHFFKNGPGNQLAGSATTNGSGNWSFTLPTLDVGANSITARATDTHGNPVPPASGNFSTARVITYDNVPAVLTVTVPAQNSFFNTKTPAFSFSSDKPGSATCQIDSGTPVACTSGWTIPASPVISEGAHTATIRWTDTAGNVTTVARNFTIDSLTPAVNITAPATNGTLLNSARPPISFTVTDTNANLLSQCRVNGGGFASCDSPYTPPALLDGPNTVEIMHTDKAGNVTTAVRGIVVDTTLPTVSVSAPANGGYSGPSSTISFSVNDVNPGASFCQIDGGAEYSCSSGDALPALADGNHTLAVRHRDGALNNGPSVSVSFTVDTTAPTVTIDWPPSGHTVTTTTPQVLFTLDEVNPASNSSCVIDGGAPTACTSPWVPSAALSQGLHTLAVTHTDLAGNTGVAAVSSFTVDSVGPAAASFNSGPGGVDRTTNDADATINFSTDEPGGTLECQWDTEGWFATGCASDTDISKTGLPEGEHSFFVRQTDAAGNVGVVSTYTWVVDQTPPPAPNVSGPNGVSSAPSETFTFYNAEQGVTFECSLDGGPWQPCSDSYSTPGTLSDAAHTFSVQSTDKAGNVSDVTTLAWVTDTSGFNVAITDAPDALSKLASHEFLFSATVHDATFTCELDGAPAVPCSSPFTYGPLDNGEHSFRVNAHQGDETVSSYLYGWTIDSTPPALTINSPADGGTSGGSATLTFSTSDGGSNGSNGSVTTTCKLDSEVETSCTSGTVFAHLTSGSHTLSVTATDLAGNETTRSTTWTVDLVPPTTTLVATPSDASTNVATRHFSFSADKPSNFECSLDGDDWTSCTTPQEITVSEGVHSFRVRATANDIVEPAPATHIWSYDTTAPAAPVITGDTLVYAADAVTFRGTAQQATGVDLYLTCETPATCGSHNDSVPVASSTVAINGNWDANFDGVPDGTYTVCARATDDAGNTSGCSTPITLMIDNSPPTVAITSPTDGALVNNSAIAFNGSDAASAVSFECEIEDLTTGDPAAFELCSPPDFAPTLVSGHEYRITARATDQIGNSADASVTFTFDDVAPARPTITSPASDRSINDSPVSIGGAAESGTVVTVIVNGTPESATTTASAGSWSYTFSPDLSEGDYAIEVTATDAFGNVSEPSATRNITVDRTAPVKPTITAPADGSGINVSRPEITGTAEAGASVELTIDGSPTPVTLTASGSGNWSHTPTSDLANGSHTLSVVTTDAAGNVSPASDTTTFIVDNEPPAVAISSPVNGSYVRLSTAVTVNFTASDNDAFTLVCRLNGSVVTPCAAPSYSFTASQGAQTFQIQATDAGGNVSTAQTTFTVDTIAPSAPTIQLPTAGSYVTGSSAWIVGSAEPNSTVRIVLSSGQDVEADVNASGDWARNFSGLPDGSYTATVTARDAAGNVSSPTNRGFFVDNIAPDALTITSPTHNSEVKSIATVSGSGAEAGSSVTVTVEGSPYPAEVDDDTGEWTVEIFPAYNTSGVAEVAVRQTDAAGNPGPITSISVRIDSTPPVVTITAPLQNSTINNPDPGIVFTATDSSPSPLVVECRVSTTGHVSAWDNCVSGWTPSTSDLPPLTEGPNNVQVRATDAAGNITTVTRQFTVDVTPPATTITSTPTSRTNNRNTTFSFTSEVGAQFKCSVDGAPFTTCSSPHSFTLPQFTDGLHSFAVKATDVAGNEGAPQNHTWTLDTLAPSKPVITSPANGDTLTDQKPNISGIAEQLSSVTIRVNGNPLATVSANGSGIWSFDFPSEGTGLLAGLPDGTYSITATASDDVGNQSVVSDTVSITIDANEPTLELESHPSAISNDTNPTFAFSANEPVKFECRVSSESNAGMWNYCGPFNVFAESGSEPFSLGQGAYKFELRGADSGNNMSEVVSYEWTIDSVAPAAPSISSPLNGHLTTETTPTVSGTAEADSTIKILLNGNATASETTADAGGNWSVVLDELADGTYNITATATDAAGNVSAESAARQITIDTTPPGSLNVAQQAGSGLNGAQPVFIISSDDTSAEMTCSIDGGAAEYCFSPYTPSQALPAGGHTLTVIFRDLAGNTSSQSLQFTATSVPYNPPPPPPPADPGQCFPKGVTITDVTAKGKKVTVAGFAKTAYVGTRVTIQYRPKPKKKAATALVKPDGTFKASFKAPAKKLWKSKKTAYRVQAGSKASGGVVTTGWTQLTRRMATTSAVWKGQRIVVTGAVTKPLYPRAKALVEARVGCNGSWKQIGSAKISKSGKFNAKLKYATDPTVVFVRVKAVVGSRPKKPRKINTGSFVIPVVIK